MRTCLRRESRQQSTQKTNTNDRNRVARFYFTSSKNIKCAAERFTWERFFLQTLRQHNDVALIGDVVIRKRVIRKNGDAISRSDLHNPFADRFNFTPALMS